MQRAHLIRMYPNREQEVLLRKTAGTSRYAYNWALAKWKEMYEAYDKGESKEKPSAFKLSAIWTKERPDWSEDTATCPQHRAILNVGEAFKNLWKGHCKFPQFHKKGRKDSFYVDNTHAYIKDQRISLPKIGKVKLAESLRFTGKIMSYTVSHYADQWHVSVQVETEDSSIQLANPTSVVGIDVGLETPVVTSDNQRLEIPQSLHKLSWKLRKQQRIISRKQKGSNNQRKALLRKQRIQNKINNIRKDITHKFTTNLAKNHGYVVTESLDASTMQTSNNKLIRKGMASSLMMEVIRQISYKAQHHIKVDKYFPSTKTCSCCGHTKDMPVNERTYKCEHCGMILDRDLNAALNIKRQVMVSAGLPVDSTASCC